MTTLKVEDLKDTDWLIGDAIHIIQAMPPKGPSQINFQKHIIQPHQVEMSQDLIDACKYKYLTIKPEALKENTVIHCRQKWMAEALAWAIDRLGYRWKESKERYTKVNRWSHFKGETCYYPYAGISDNVDYFKNTPGCKILSLWDAVVE